MTDASDLQEVLVVTGMSRAQFDALVALGHDPRRVRTERFGSGGGGG